MYAHLLDHYFSIIKTYLCQIVLNVLVTDPENYYDTSKKSESIEKLREVFSQRDSDDDFEPPTKKQKPSKPVMSGLEELLLDNDETDLEPDREAHAQSPVFKKSKIYAKKSSAPEPKTPENIKVTNPKEILEVLFELGIEDLKGKLVQLLSWTGESRKEIITLKISDGLSWVKCTLDDKYRINLVGKMLVINDVFRILEYTGSVHENNLKLVILALIKKKILIKGEAKKTSLN